MSSQLRTNSGLHRALSEVMERLVDFNASGDESKRTLQMYLLAAVLTKSKGNQCQAARWLGIHRNTISRQIEELHLEPLVEQLVKKNGPQMKLFQQPLRKFPGRAGLPPTSGVLNRNPQGRNGASSQLMNRVAAGSA